ncbi:MAG: hypothetical protein HY741_29680, partial [Chloroflexi bacterium]|nr:hypothetical protein [Chloroflexota bacterium]
KFLTLEIPWTNEGWGGKCDELEVYYDLGIAAWGDGKSYSTQKNFGWGGEKCQGPTIFNCIGDPGYLMQLKRIICQDVPYYYTFQQLGGGFGVPYPDTLVVPMPDKDISIRVGTNFYDHDQGDDDAFGKHRAEHKYPDLQSAQKELGCGGKTFRNPENVFLIDDDADTAINYTLTVYPNACSDFPLGVPLPVPPWAPNK